MSDLLYIKASDQPIAGGALVEGWWIATAHVAPVVALPDEETVRCAGMAAPAAAALRRAAYALRRAMLAERTGRAPAAIVIPETYRAPVVDGAFVSLSHTHGAVAVVCADSPVGIDVERVERCNDPARLAARYFAAGELAADAATFAWRWTAKEALMKATGLTLRAALATPVGSDESLPFTRVMAGAAVTVLAPIEGFAVALARA